MASLLFQDITVVTADGGVQRHVYVAVQNGKIASVTETCPIAAFDRVIQGKGKVLIPGLCNTHTHVPMTLLRGIGDDMNLQDWLFDKIFPAEEKLTDALVYWGARLALLEMLACGTTAFTDMYNFIDVIAESVLESGMKANLCAPLFCMSGDFNPETDERLHILRDNIDHYHNADNGRLKIDSGIHAEYTSNPAVWRAAAALAGERGLAIQLHLSETQKEHNDCIEKYGKTPAAALDEAGLFAVPATAAHGVWLSGDDLDLLADRGVTVAHCPVSNLKLGSGVAPVRDMLQKGVAVTLGTDGTASNNNLDLWEEVKMAALLHRDFAKRDEETGESCGVRAALGGKDFAACAPQPKTLPLETIGGVSDAPKPPHIEPLGAKSVFYMATRAGARSQGRLLSGDIRVGFDADLCLLDFHAPNLVPCPDEVSHLAYAVRGSNVCMTIVRGEILYENGLYTTLDKEKILREAAAAAGKLTG